MIFNKHNSFMLETDLFDHVKSHATCDMKKYTDILFTKCGSYIGSKSK